MRQIETVIDIDAPARLVWAILTDFRAYAQWNPFIIAAEGEPVQGAKLKITVAPPGRKPMTFRPVVQIAARERELRWLGHFFFRGLFDGEHMFRLEQRRDACRFHHAERFSGFLLERMGEPLFMATLEGFEAMNEALKTRAEDA
jgi:hypothetical protein